MLTTLCIFIVVSLLDRQEFDMDQLLHRGAYAVEGDNQPTEASAPSGGLSIFKMGPEFARDDKLLFIGSYAYIFVFFAAFLIGTVYMLSTDISDEAWGQFWWYFCVVILLMTTAVTVVVCVGGIKNLRELYAMLTSVNRDAHDDGTVVDGRSLADVHSAGDK